MDILSLDGTATVAAGTKFRSAKVTWAIDGSGAAEINLMPEDVASGDWLYGRRRLLFRDGESTARYQGWLDRLERSGRPSEVIWRAASRGLAAILDQRVVHADLLKQDVVATTIATDLISHIVAQPDDATNFTIGTITGSAAVLERQYHDGDVISDAINELANMDGGFTWEIAQDGAFNAWVGGRGADLSGTVTLAPSDVTTWADVGDITELASYETGIGHDESCGPIIVIASNDLRTDYGRREFVIDADTEIVDEVIAKTLEELRARACSGSNLKVAWIEGRGPWAFGDVWLGDIVNVERGAEFGGDAPMRLITASISLEPGKHEFCEFEFEGAAEPGAVA